MMRIDPVRLFDDDAVDPLWTFDRTGRASRCQLTDLGCGMFGLHTPYDPALVMLLKAARCRWAPELKAWTFEAGRGDSRALLDLLRSYAFTASDRDARALASALTKGDGR